MSYIETKIKDLMSYKNLKELQDELDKFIPKDDLDYVLHGSQLNYWLEYLKNKPK